MLDNFFETQPIGLKIGDMVLLDTGFPTAKELHEFLSTENAGASKAKVSPQLQLASVQWLAANLAPFSDDFIADGVLHRMVKQTSKNSQNVRCDIPTPLAGMPPKVLYKRDELTDKFVLILEGRITVTIGQSNQTFEAGPFHVFGKEVIEKMHKIAPSFTAAGTKAFTCDLTPSTTGFRNLASFKPDFTATIDQEVKYLLVSAGTYLSAYRASLIERGRALGSSRHSASGALRGDAVPGKPGTFSNDTGPEFESSGHRQRAPSVGALQNLSTKSSAEALQFASHFTSAEKNGKLRGDRKHTSKGTGSQPDVHVEGERQSVTTASKSENLPSVESAQQTQITGTPKNSSSVEDTHAETEDNINDGAAKHETLTCDLCEVLLAPLPQTGNMPRYVKRAFYGVWDWHQPWRWL